jgi:hypothetical protein
VSNDPRVDQIIEQVNTLIDQGNPPTLQELVDLSQQKLQPKEHHEDQEPEP